MFGCLPLDGPHREGGLLAGLRTYSNSLSSASSWIQSDKFWSRQDFNKKYAKNVVVCRSRRIRSRQVRAAPQKIARY